MRGIQVFIYFKFNLYKIHIYFFSHQCKVVICWIWSVKPGYVLNIIYWRFTIHICVSSRYKRHTTKIYKKKIAAITFKRLYLKKINFISSFKVKYQRYFLFFFFLIKYMTNNYLWYRYIYIACLLYIIIIFCIKLPN